MSLAPTPEAQAPAADEPSGSEDEAVEAFARLGTPEDTKDEAEPENEPGDDEAEEVSEPDEPEADDEATDALVEAEFEGKTYKVPPELQKALLRQADYSRKMNEVGAQEKAYVAKIAEAETLVTGAAKYAEALADVNSADAQLKQFESVNWAQLRADNPAEYAALAADMQTLRLMREQAVTRAKGVGAEIEATKSQGLAQARNEMDKALSRDLKGWGNDLGAKISEYAIASGYQPQDLATVTDPKWVIAMDKARRFDALQAAKADIKAKAKDAPTFVKPGSPRKANPQADAMAQLRKDNSTESAEAAFLQRMR